MVKNGDKVVFRSKNDGQEHTGTVRDVADSAQVRETFGSDVVIVETPGRGRGWEIASGSDVRSA